MNSKDIKRERFSRRLRLEVKRSHVSNKHLASIMDNGNGTYYMHNIDGVLSGKILPNSEIIQRLSDFFGVRYEYMSGESENFLIRTNQELQEINPNIVRSKEEKASEIVKRLKGLKEYFGLKNTDLIPFTPIKSKSDGKNDIDSAKRKITRILNGYISPPPIFLHNLAEYFGVRYEYLCAENEFPTQAAEQELLNLKSLDVERLRAGINFLKTIGFEFIRKDIEDSDLGEYQQFLGNKADLIRVKYNGQPIGEGKWKQIFDTEEREYYKELFGSSAILDLNDVLDVLKIISPIVASAFITVAIEKRTQHIYYTSYKKGELSNALEHPKQ